MGLDDYNAKRRFADTPEPEGRVRRAETRGPLAFVVQKHAATRLHWDVRLEWGGVLLSWAVTRGPSSDPAQKRLAVRTEDHPLDYGGFEGVIAPGNYGAGTMMLWDRGTWEPLPGTDFAEGLAAGKLKFRLNGTRMTGGWTLVRMRPRDPADAKRENWLLIKERDADATDQPDDLVDTHVTSVESGRGMEAIADVAAQHGQPSDQSPPRAANTKTGPRKARQDTFPRPRFVQPQLATLASEPPATADWWHEAKLDGYRGQIAFGSDGVTIYSRSGADWTEQFGALLADAARLPCRSVLLDGEVIAPDGGFSALQTALKVGGPLLFVAFDILHLDGRDLRDQPLSERRAALERIVPPRATGAIRISPTVNAGGIALQRLCAAGGEGVIAKRTDASYRSGRGGGWVKIKCRNDAEFIVVGHAPSASAGRPFASLLLATRDDGKLVYRGKVGTGFDGGSFADLSGRFADLTTSHAPVSAPAAETRGARWLRPELVVQVRFAEFTGDGRIRHGVFQGLREDKAADHVAREDALHATPADHADTEPGSAVILRQQRISSPDRIVFPDCGVTKADVARYYDAVATRMIPHLRGRPLSLLRHPDGIGKPGFFQKHRGPGFPDAIEEMDVAGDRVMVINQPKGLIAAAQVGSIEFHVRGSRTDRADRPDRLVFDLDPDPTVGFDQVRGAAVDLRDRLSALGLPSWPLVTGGKGVHIVVNLRRSASTETVELFARAFCVRVAAAEPARFTATMSKRSREGRIFLDWLRNQSVATAVARGRCGHARAHASLFP